MAATRNRLLPRILLGGTLILCFVAGAAWTRMTATFLAPSNFQDETTVESEEDLMGIDRTELATRLKEFDRRRGILSRDFRPYLSSRYRGERVQYVASLALGPWHEEASDLLVQFLYRANAEEVEVIVQRLKPNRLVKTELWNSLFARSSGGIKIRAACALATLSPRSQRWRAAAPLVASALVRAPVLELPDWARLLKEVRGHLSSDLANLLHIESPELSNRRIAAEILSLWNPNDLPLLASFIVEFDSPIADPFLARLPLANSRDTADLRELLAKSLRPMQTPKWPEDSVSEYWKPISKNLIDEFVLMEGLVTEDFALSFQISLERFDLISAKLTECGFRPIRLRPFLASGKKFAAAIWLRDGVSWKSLIGKERGELTAWMNSFVRANYIPIDLSSIDRITGKSQFEFSAIFGKKTGDEIVETTIAAPFGGHSQNTRRMIERGFAPNTIQVTKSADNSAIVTQIWERKSPAVTPSSQRFNISPNEFAKHDSAKLADITATIDEGGIKFNAINAASDFAVDHEFFAETGKGTENALTAAKELSALAFRPNAISVVVDKAGVFHWVVVWNRPTQVGAEVVRMTLRKARAINGLVLLGDWPNDAERGE